MPRRFLNQSETSAISGPKVVGRAEHADHQRLRQDVLPQAGRLRGEHVARAQHQRADDHRQHDANRSDSRPISTPPTAKPSMVAV